MKIAVCLHGYFRTGQKDVAKIKTFAKTEEVDYFIHSWEPKLEAFLIDLYNPKGFKFEKQKDFREVMEDENISQEWFDEGFQREGTMYSKALIERSLSFFYGRQQVLSLIDGEYDWVFVTRFDLGPRYDAFPSNFLLTSDPTKVFASYFDQLNCGMADRWFIHNQKDAEIHATIYDRVLGYFKKESPYITLMTEGWPDSEEFPFGVTPTADPQQFSNVVLSGGAGGPLMKYPKWYCVNNHALYKYFFIDTNLYNKIEYL